MDPRIEKLLELTQENNEILKKMRRSQLTASRMRALYWFIIIGLSVGAFYFLEPYIENLQEVWSGANNTLEQFKNFRQ